MPIAVAAVASTPNLANLSASSSLPTYPDPTTRPRHPRPLPVAAVHRCPAASPSALARSLAARPPAMTIDADVLANTPRLDAAPSGRDKDDTPPTLPLSAPSRPANLPHGKMQRDPNPPPLPSALRLRPDNTVDAPSHRVAFPTATAPTRHDHRVAPAVGVPESHTARAGRRPLPDSRSAPSTQHHQHPLSSRASQDTSTTNDTDLVFTPPISEGGMSPGAGSARDSSQESQLMQLSNAAAARERIPEASSDDSTDASGNGHSSRKRMADGVVKSPVRTGGHSRNTSTVSMASTTGSRIGEVSLVMIPRRCASANSSPALGRAQDPLVLCNGQGPPRLAGAHHGSD